MAFSATESAFQGFRIIRREPWSIVAWGVFGLIFSLISVVVFVPVLGPVMTGFAGAGAASAAAPNMALLARLGMVYLIALPFVLMLVSVLTCAVYRTVLRPEERGLGRLKLGADEFRMALLFLALALIYFVGLVVLVLVVALIVGVTAAAVTPTISATTSTRTTKPTK